MDEREITVREAERSARGGLSDIAARLAEHVGARAGVQAIFGDPVERDGVTVIPVGRSRWGFGGGGGQGGRADEQGEGSGGGGGAISEPVGYIEIAGGAVAFRRIGSPVSPATILAAGVALLLLVRATLLVLRRR